MLAMIGPSLHVLLLDRLVQRGDRSRPARGNMGSVRLHELVDGGTGQRDRLLSAVRETLVDRADTPDQTVAVAATLSASGVLRSFAS
nr:hypothetical protein [Actinoplanes polyasparticus]